MDDLNKAFERQSVQLQQAELMIELLKKRVSELESKLIKVRNALND